MSIAILGIDLGKNSCSVVGLDEGGTVVLRRRMRREGVVAFASKLAPCVMAMEACCGAHHMGRALAAQGHEIRLMSPEYVNGAARLHQPGGVNVHHSGGCVLHFAGGVEIPRH